MYTSGESALLHVDVKNNSNVDIDSFIVKVIAPDLFWCSLSHYELSQNCWLDSSQISSVKMEW